MKLIKINIILKQIAYFIGLYILVNTQLEFSPIGGIENAKHFIQGAMEQPLGEVLTLILVTMFQIGPDGILPTINIGIVTTYALLWSVFYERQEQYHSLDKFPKKWTILLFVLSSVLAIGSLILSFWQILIIIRRLHSANSIISFVCLLPALITKNVLQLSPCFIAVQSGKALFKKDTINKI